MDLNALQRDWNAFGKSDPFWAILTDPARRGNKWRPDEFFETGVCEVRELLRYLESLGVEVQRRMALDFGCGAGRLSQALAAHFEEVHGVDVAPSMIELANRLNRCPQRCVYHVNASERLELFEDQTFDLIYSNITLQHIPPRISKQYIAEFIRTLRRDGVVVFQVPSRPANPVKEAVKRAAAKSLLRCFRTLGYINRPVIVMHSIKREDVVRLLMAQGAQVLDVAETESAGKSWVTHRYCATKP